MTRKFRVDIETNWASVGETDYFEMPDDATDEEIADEAREVFFNCCNYGYSEVTEQEESARELLDYD